MFNVPKCVQSYLDFLNDKETEEKVLVVHQSNGKEKKYILKEVEENAEIIYLFSRLDHEADSKKSS